jgi:hypothetical protein
LKKIVPFIVLWLFLTGSGGYFIAFKLRQYINYHAIENKIINSHNRINQDILVFTIGNATGIKWIRKQKEFIYHGQMYDIVSIKISGKHVYYYCINDTKEKKLKTEFENRNRANNRANEITRKIIQSYFIIPSPTFTVFKQTASYYFIQPASYYLPPPNNTLSPPPKSFGIA